MTKEQPMNDDPTKVYVLTQPAPLWGVKHAVLASGTQAEMDALVAEHDADHAKGYAVMTHEEFERAHRDAWLEEQAAAQAEHEDA